MGKLINIDNGGTLTDIVVVEGNTIFRTKTLTTPYDLSKCFFEGLKKASREIYGDENVVELLRTTDYIRYSTTQGTNALVERKGPRLGLALPAGTPGDVLRQSPGGEEMFEALFDQRLEAIDLSLEGAAFEAEVVRVVNALASAGANRLVIGALGPDHEDQEKRIRRIILRKFPSHLLGAIPVLFSHEIGSDLDDARRIWTAAFNAFLHPAMETFLYHAENILREHRFKTPLLIFRNDGDSARVAKTVALKTYSSGPRGGMEGARALAAQHGAARLVTVDVGGTTTDIGLVEHDALRSRRRGAVESVEISLPLVDVVSVGVGGGSIIRAEDGRIKVGPESVGAQPGPACFGLGGKLACITDVCLLTGILDPKSYFGGELTLDTGRAEAAINENVAGALGLPMPDALAAMEWAWVDKVADSIRRFTDITPDTTLAAFGGGGPLLICDVADRLGVRKVIVPALAAVFSAFGLGFSDIAHHYEAVVPEGDMAGLDALVASLLERARRDMYAEGFELEECEQAVSLLRVDAAGEAHPLAYRPGQAPDVHLTAGEHLTVSMRVTKPIEHVAFEPVDVGTASDAVAAGTRRVCLPGDDARDIPLVRIADNAAGATGSGPAVIEEDFFTCRVPAGWRYRFAGGMDLVLEKAD
ncbi:hydantoinase/oxoprolinase family protein [Azoarcus sp. L1K30]|uniref:hydantoinase/oxoprolinase family protein n=1 Tax=Azoarcus sp. L1K30 TaxID=2820277 RepID=UPI001B822306|nr:hydantoinase/oxoprolinase family protein [Azoarcus sp. L1K30]